MIFRLAFKDSLPVLMGYSTMGFAAGLLLAVDGAIAWTPAWAAATSATFVSGPLQYVFVDWVRTSLALSSVLLVTVCINFRYALYGLSLVEPFRSARWWLKLYLIGTITDETYALQTFTKLTGRARLVYCAHLAALDHCYWIAGVTAGALAGVFAKAVFSPEKVAHATKGVDFAMTALFLVIFADQLRVKANRAPAAIGLAASVLVLGCLGRADMLAPSAALIVGALMAGRRWLDGR